MKRFFFILLLFFSISAVAQTTDTDTDGIPDSEDLCPGLPGPKTTNGCPAEKKEFTEEDRKILVKNFLLILNDVKTGFQKIKTGETDWDVYTREGKSSSSVVLFPSYTDAATPVLLFVNYNGKPVSVHNEISPADVNTVVSALTPVFKQKGFIEVNFQAMNSSITGRTFRSKEAVFEIGNYSKTGNVVINIGKLPNYYTKDVVAVSTKPPVNKTTTQVKQVIEPAPQTEISLANVIQLANAEIKKKLSPAFKTFATSKLGRTFLLSGTETNFKVAGMYQSIVATGGNEIVLQYKKEADRSIATLYANPSSSLSRELGSEYKELVKDDNSLEAIYGNVTISMNLMEGPERKYATLIFIRPNKIAGQAEIKEDANSVFITPENFRIILHHICQNSMHLQKAGGPVVDKRIPTSLKKNGKQQNLLVAYQLTDNDKILQVYIPLSKNKTDFDAILNYVNGLFTTTKACDGEYKVFKLQKSDTKKNYASCLDAPSFENYSIMIRLGEKIISPKETQIELVITRIDNRKSVPSKPVAGQVASCNDFKQIFEAASDNFKQIKGKKIKFVNAFESDYEAALPLLGAEEGKLVEEFIDGENYYHYELFGYKPSQELTTLLNNTISQLEKCYKLHTKISDTQKSNRRIVEYRIDGDDGKEYYMKFELATNEKGSASLWMYFHPPGD